MSLCLDDPIILGAVAALCYPIDESCLPLSILCVPSGLWGNSHKLDRPFERRCLPRVGGLIGKQA